MEDGFMFMPMVISLGFFAMIVWIVWLGTNAKNRRAQVQADVQAKLIERFSTSKEFIEFLQSPAGQRFVSGVEVSTAIYARDRNKLVPICLGEANHHLGGERVLLGGPVQRDQRKRVVTHPHQRKAGDWLFRFTMFSGVR